MRLKETERVEKVHRRGVADLEFSEWLRLTEWHTEELAGLQRQAELQHALEMEMVRKEQQEELAMRKLQLQLEMDQVTGPQTRGLGGGGDGPWLPTGRN